ncbi:MAG: inositol monophosphatase [Candidatus Dadabacteria bacterium]|nr:MAG: inositol monophosphatase [Candidatus Dadabacteria bacterium]
MKIASEEILETAIGACVEASCMLKERFSSKGFKTSCKSSRADLVTTCDLESEKMIVEAISKRYPNHAILTEETACDLEELDFNAPLWIIDPLDGTVNYAHGIPYYAISVGFMVEGSVIVGVVHIPTTGVTYTAIKGRGAFKKGERIYVSDTETLAKAVIATGFPYKRDEETIEEVSNSVKSMLREVGGIRRFGAAALDLCWVAEGVIDGFYEAYLNPWDIAAGGLIVREAGGKVCTLKPSPKPLPEDLKCTGYLAATPAIADPLASWCQAPRKKRENGSG